MEKSQLNTSPGSASGDLVILRPPHSVDAEDKATAAGVGLSTLKDFENGKRVPIQNNLAAIRSALESLGMGFVSATDGNGKTWARGITYAEPDKGSAH